MTISQIYKKYHIPVNLQQHMLRVAAVGMIICDNIESIRVDQDLVVKTLLLHDMGNILKMNLNDTRFFVEEDKANIPKYKKTQEEFVEKYADDADDVTIGIIREITDDQRIPGLCQQIHSESLDIFLTSDKWNHKICYYSDMRIGPNGIVSVGERFEDLIKRYPGRAEMPTWHQQCKIIESQLQEVVTINLQSIADTMLESQFDKLKRVEI